MLQYGKKDSLKTATGEPMKHFSEIQRLFTATYCPKEVAVMHCKGHSRGGSKVAQKNGTLGNPLPMDTFDLDGSWNRKNHNILRKN